MASGALLAIATVWAPVAHGQSIVVGTGSSWAAGDATHELGCHDFIVAEQPPPAPPAGAR